MIFNKCAQKLDGKIFDLLFFLVTQSDKFKAEHIKDSVEDTFEKVVPWISTNLALLVYNLQIVQGLDRALALISPAFEQNI